MRKVIRFLASLKLAVVILLSLAGALAAATFIESLKDTPTAQYYVYRSVWFHALLGTLGVNIFTVAASRFPWKKSQIPFLLAHLGILTLLAGSWITDHHGLDGNMRIAEGETQSMVELARANLEMSEGGKAYRIPIQWQPPGVKFRAFSAREHGLPYDVQVDGFLSHADVEYAFVPASIETGFSALHFRLTGGPMGIAQDFWLWTGDPQFSQFQAGPARFSIANREESLPADLPGQPSLGVFSSDGGFSYRATSSKGAVVRGAVRAIPSGGLTIEPGWKMLKLTFLEWVPSARPQPNYHPARNNYGPEASPSAIHVRTGAEASASGTWLGLGDRAMLHVDGKDVELGYLPERLVLPFSVRLNHFTVGHDPGSRDPSSYASEVVVNGKEGTRDAEISMNEPLVYSGITLYQASFEDAKPRPVVSIFSVNRDPGRFWKYLGSLLIVSGTILLFAARYRREYLAKAAKKREREMPR